MVVVGGPCRHIAPFSMFPILVRAWSFFYFSIPPPHRHRRHSHFLPFFFLQRTLHVSQLGDLTLRPTALGSIQVAARVEDDEGAILAGDELVL